MIQLKRLSGFTLIEIMIVMFIIAVMCTFGYAGLNNTIKHSNQIGEIRDQLEELQLAISLLQQDVTQTVNRNIINEYGSEEHALLAEENSSELLKLSRAGWPNPAGQARSSIARIEWLLDDNNNLVRRRWYELDRSPGAEPIDTIVLRDIESVAMEFLDDDNNWQPIWPNINNLGPEGTAITIPRAADITITTKRWGDIRRLFEILDAPQIPPPDFGASAGGPPPGSGTDGGNGGDEENSEDQDNEGER